jgi:hypothetical protein
VLRRLEVSAQRIAEVIYAQLETPDGDDPDGKRP